MSLIQDLVHKVEDLSQKLYMLEKERGSLPKAAVQPFYQKQKAVSRTFGRAWAPHAIEGVHLAVCVDTRDPWKMGRIMIYCPIIHNLTDTKTMSESSLSWAMPCAAFGSIDEVGAVFVPPEGSTVLVAFEGGNRSCPYYLGSTWLPRRANPAISDDDFSPQRESYRWGKKRQGDVRNQLPDHLLPPWNNESYYGNDLKPQGELEVYAEETKNKNVTGSETTEQRVGESGGGYSTQGWRSADIPHMYGIKTPEKHFILFDDGSYEREGRLFGKRLVLQSSKGSTIFMKDDNDQTGEEIFNHKFWDPFNDKVSQSDSWFSKAANGHAVELNHTGVQIQSFGGGRIIIDDKIKGDLEQGQNEWTSHFPPKPKLGKTLWRTMIRLESHTEHRITLSDHHVEDELIRSPKDGVFISSACGHFIGLKDHTTMEGKAGEERMILIQSTSGHKIELKDNRCSIKSRGARAIGRYSGSGQRGYRDEDVYDAPNFKSDGQDMGEKVCMKFTSGFGQYLLFEDGSKQNDVTEQYLELGNAPGWNDPYNFLRMNQVTGQKLVWLRCAGERLTTVERNYRRITKMNELLVATLNQVHVVDEQDMIDAVLQRNLIQYCKLGDHIVYCKEGVQITYALQNTMHLCYANPHIILGGVPPDGGDPPDGAGYVLLYDANGELNKSRVSKWLMAN